MLDMDKRQICGDKLKHCLETDTPIHAFVPKGVPYKGTHVTEEMREKWAKLEVLGGDKLISESKEYLKQVWK